MARFVYSLAVWALLPWAALHLLWRGRRQPAYLRHWGERFGIYRRAPAVAPAPTFWIHAVSVGETRAAQPVIAALRQQYPDHRIVITHMTPTGRETSEALFGEKVQRLYLPYDSPWATQRFLNRLRPSLGLIMETELWPNLIAHCHARGMPLLLVNARLSERSAKRYAWFPNLAREALQGLAAIGAQSAADAQRLGKLGGRAIEITGNLKFDIEPPEDQVALGETFRRQLGDRNVFLAASTREGEEALILEAWQKHHTPLVLLPENERTMAPLLIVVPRHPQRFDDVVALARGHGYQVQRRSDKALVAETTDVLIGDSMGEMFAWYVAADVAFVGGSLLNYGSQNLIEPCAVGTPVLIGPSTFNFAEAAAEAIACGAARRIEGAQELVAVAIELLADPASRTSMGKAGRQFTERHRGATARTLALIERYKPTLS